MIKSYNRIINDVGVLKRFTGKCFKLTHINKKLNTDAIQNRKHTEKGTAGNDGKLLDNMRRTKERIFALAVGNPWGWGRERGVEGKRGGLGGRRIIQKKKQMDAP